VVEHSAVNRRVVGSNPTRGVKDRNRFGFCLFSIFQYKSTSLLLI